MAAICNTPFTRFFDLAGGTDSSSWVSMANGIWGTANRIYYYPFVLPTSFTVATHFIAQQTQGAGSLGRVGVYSAAGAKVGESNGTIDLTTAGTNVIRKTAPSSPYVLTAGTYYYMAMTVNTAGAWTGINGGGTGWATTSKFGASNGFFQEAGSGTLPATATFGTFTNGDPIWLFGISSSTAVPL